MKETSAEYQRRWRKDNKEKSLSYARNFRERHKEKIKESSKISYHKNKERRKEQQKLNSKKWNDKNKERKKEWAKVWYQKNKDRIKLRVKEYNKNKRNNDPLFKLAANMRTTLNNLLKDRGYIKKARTIDIVGCTYAQLLIHLENKFESWMTWDNYGLYNGELNYGWDIDHIIPLSSAKTEEELLKLNHYTNLQPLCGYINRRVKRGLF
jgi:hypothetical protein